MNIPVDPGQEYKATLQEVTLRDGKKGPYLMWVFTDEDGTRRVGFTDGELRTGNRTWTWLIMLGVKVEVGLAIDLSLLKSIPCRIFLGVGEETVRMIYRAQPAVVVTPVPVKVEPPKATPTQSADGKTEAEWLFT